MFQKVTIGINNSTMVVSHEKNVAMKGVYRWFKTIE